MASAAQIAANLANSRKSTGPRTQAGKDRARLNAVKHALTGQLTIVTPDDHAAFTALEARMTADLAPLGEQEQQIAHRIVRDTWRLARASANEENIYALGLLEDSRDIVVTDEVDDTSPALTHARTFLKHARDFNLMSLYEQRLHRSLSKDYQLYRAIQKDRKRLETSYIAKPFLKQEPQNGFVSSTPVEHPFGLDPNAQTGPEIVDKKHPYVPHWPDPIPKPVLMPFWPC